jgi:predicted AlkP superfamily pyrophosphatase or phosphodiesterase
MLAACGSNAGGSAPGEQVDRSAAALSDTVSAANVPGAAKKDIRRVLLISVDGMHEADLTTYVAAHPAATLAALTATGVEYTDAHTTTPSDSSPGMTAQVTGGTPKTTGIYYDDSYDRTLFAPGTNCVGDPGVETRYEEEIETDDSQLFSPINPGNLPLRKMADGSCKPVFPHDFITTNTIFEVIHAFGGHTAWSDKHAAYEMFSGPSGTGLDDLYAPEINSLIVNGGVANGVNLTASLAQCDGVTNSLPLKKVTDYTTCGPSIQAYDDTKVQAIINEIDGLKSDGSVTAPVPTIFGMNFQQVSVGQKLPIGGYTNGGTTPTAFLQAQLDHVDASLGRMVAELKAKGLYDSTLFIVSAKHGQSPRDRSTLHMETGGRGTTDVTNPLPTINTVDPGVEQVFSTFVNPNSGSPYAIEGHFQTDDVGIVWLQNQASSNISGVAAALQGNAVAIHADVLPPGTIFDANITSAAQLAEIFGDPTSGDPVAAARAPNVFIQPNHGVIYSGSTKKIAEHGGGSLDDTNVLLLVSNPALNGHSVSAHVTTTQIAPTILRALNIPENQLLSVVKEGTKALPGTGL